MEEVLVYPAEYINYAKEFARRLPLHDWKKIDHKRIHNEFVVAFNTNRYYRVPIHPPLNIMSHLTLIKIAIPI